MKLSELRKVTAKRNLRIRFALANGMECVLDEHGVARIPALRSTPDFNLSDELERVERFLVEPVLAGNKPKSKPKPYELTREQLAAWVAPAAAEGAPEESGG